jgi:RNase P/RNase MRP subunit POP5
MSRKLQELHTLTAYATIAHKKYLAGMMTKEEFVKQIDDLDCHCHGDIVLDKEHAELDVCYRELLDGILRVYHLENKET